MSHTKEPWYVVDSPWGDGTWINAGAPDPHHEGFVADCEDINGDVDKDTARSNARRIVACVNACAGFNTDFLEGPCGNLFDAMDGLLKAKQQRDDLLAALESMVQIARMTIGWSCTPVYADGPLVVAERLIAIVKGGAA